jgi:hypothetical protein
LTHESLVGPLARRPTAVVQKSLTLSLCFLLRFVPALVLFLQTYVRRDHFVRQQVSETGEMMQLSALVSGGERLFIMAVTRDGRVSQDFSIRWTAFRLLKLESFVSFYYCNCYFLTIVFCGISIIPCWIC